MEQRKSDPAAQAELEQTQIRIRAILADLSVIQGAWRHLLVAEPPVHDDLNLDGAQREKIREITADIEPRGERFGDLLKMSREQRDGRIVDDMRRHETEIAGVLTPAQSVRFEQIALQSRGMSAFRDPTVIAKLKLTNDQRERLRFVEGETGPPPGEGPRGEFGPGGPKRGSPEHGPGPRGNVEKALAILTPEQAKVWQALIGPKFTGFRPRGPGPRDREGGPDHPGGRGGPGDNR